jgi:hypothetical protein
LRRGYTRRGGHELARKRRHLNAFGDADAYSLGRTIRRAKAWFRKKACGCVIHFSIALGTAERLRVADKAPAGCHRAAASLLYLACSAAGAWKARRRSLRCCGLRNTFPLLLPGKEGG